ncbi:hypothetical protein Xmau_02233 [Xenorhabdus mauleonii]|uniref:Competence protein ComEA n=1 Tax=Xenorhabdus mauleonii TaxID=351675 RepID=A0A1I3Q940_9GAMM|nr:ComEA family DNA-binding protein [Xenorhabdus mauleonii]PHM40049.1 hypothetical protein Xmau_02233 [Xenorhabdus mauleonii]SFJ30072.1 competence protein ComEA [Xenorhabdus mauleonii]
MKYLRIVFNSFIMALCLNTSLSYAATTDGTVDKAVKPPINQHIATIKNQDTKVGGEAAAGQQISGKELLNINTANAEELVKELNGIGVKKAQAIIEYREKYGPFTAIEQLQEVQGIGPIFIEKNRGKLTH